MGQHTTKIIYQFIIKKLHDYEKCIKIKLDSDDKLTLKKRKKKKKVMAIVVRAIFYENNKYYPKDFRWMSV